MSTSTELVLSAAYRHAQRTIAPWLEQAHANARQRAFAARAALANLDPLERNRLARWLAWWCVSISRRGEASLAMRILRLDVALHQAVETAMARLPLGAVTQQLGSREQRRRA